MNVDTIFKVYNPYLASGGTGSLSRFLRRDPLTLRGPGGAGAGVQVGLGERVGLNLLYLASDANDPSANGKGLFNGGYSAGAQLTFNPSDRLDLAFTYLRTYETNRDTSIGLSGVNLASGTSSNNSSRPFGNDGASADRFGLQGNLRISPRINIAASGGYVSANNLTNVSSTRENAELWTWFTGISFLDVGKEGAVFSIAGGMPPRSQYETDTSYLVELQYRYPINRNITITPGVYAIFNPEHNSNNDTVYIGAIRTTFSF